MRRVLVMAVVAGVLGVAAVSTAGCARDSAAGATPAGEASAGDWPAGVKEAEVYVQVLRRYFSPRGESSFPEGTFKTIYVLDQANPNAGDPHGGHERGTRSGPGLASTRPLRPIAPNTQREITAALAGLADVVFIADRSSATEPGFACAVVKAGGILVTLGTLEGDDREVRVGINGFVACDGATWLTYVVQNQPGAGWRVTGTTGRMAIA